MYQKLVTDKLFDIRKNLSPVQALIVDLPDISNHNKYQITPDG